MCIRDRFLVIENLLAKDFLQQNLLLEELRTSSLEVLVDKQIKKSQTRLDRGLERSSEYYLNKYFFKKHIQSLKANFNRQESVKKTISQEFYGDLSENLSAFYVIEKLRLATNVLNWRKLYKSDIKIDVENVSTIIEKHSLESSECFSIIVETFSTSILMSDL